MAGEALRSGSPSSRGLFLSPREHTYLNNTCNCSNVQLSEIKSNCFPKCLDHFTSPPKRYKNLIPITSTTPLAPPSPPAWWVQNGNLNMLFPKHLRSWISFHMYIFHFYFLCVFLSIICFSTGLWGFFIYCDTNPRPVYVWKISSIPWCAFLPSWCYFWWAKFSVLTQWNWSIFYFTAGTCTLFKQAFAALWGHKDNLLHGRPQVTFIYDVRQKFNFIFSTWIRNCLSSIY